MGIDGGATPRRRRRPGRPDKLTPERQEAIVLALEAAAPLETAALQAGIAARTLNYWLRGQGSAGRRGRPRGRKFVLFGQAVEKAIALAETALVARVQKAALQERHWTAAAWLLERRWPDRWARHERFEGADGGPIAVKTIVVLEAPRPQRPSLTAGNPPVGLLTERGS